MHEVIFYQKTDKRTVFLEYLDQTDILSLRIYHRSTWWFLMHILKNWKWFQTQRPLPKRKNRYFNRKRTKTKKHTGESKMDKSTQEWHQLKQDEFNNLRNFCLGKENEDHEKVKSFKCMVPISSLTHCWSEWNVVMLQEHWKNTFHIIKWAFTLATINSKRLFWSKLCRQLFHHLDKAIHFLDEVLHIKYIFKFTASSNYKSGKVACWLG